MNSEQLRKLIYEELFNELHKKGHKDPKGRDILKDKQDDDSDDIGLEENKLGMDAINTIKDIAENPWSNPATEFLKAIGIDLEAMSEKGSPVEKGKELSPEQKEELLKQGKEKIKKLDDETLQKANAGIKKAKEGKKSKEYKSGQKQRQYKNPDAKVKNPKTGRVIKATSALKKGHPAQKIALKTLIKKKEQ